MTRRLGRLFANAMAVTGILVIAAALAVVVVVPWAVGGASLTVLSGSMAPSIPKGSLVIVKPVDPTTLAVGDVITWQVRPGEATYVTHRIVEIHDTQPLTFITKGDANERPDRAPVPAGAIRGRVVLDVPKIGAVADAVNSRTGIALLVGLGAAAVVTGLGRGLLASRRGRDVGTSAPDTTAVGADRGMPAEGALILIHSTAWGEHRRCLLDLVSLLRGRVVEATDSYVRAAVVVGGNQRLDSVGDLIGSLEGTSVHSTTVFLHDVASAPSAERSQRSTTSSLDDISDEWVLVGMTLDVDITRRGDLIEALDRGGGAVTSLTATSSTVLIAGPSGLVDELADSWDCVDITASGRSSGITWPGDGRDAAAHADLSQVQRTLALAATTNGTSEHAP